MGAESTKEIIEIQDDPFAPMIVGYLRSKVLPKDYETSTKLVRLPCGNGITWKLASQVTEDVLCPCGDPRHWLVRVEK